MNIFAKFIKSYSISMSYHRATRLYNAKQYDEALKIISNLDATPEYNARVVLFEADILHRMGDILNSKEKYESFLREGVQSISKEADRQYLTAYAQYYLENVKRKLDPKFLITTKRDYVVKLRSHASYLIRGEFVI